MKDIQPTWFIEHPIDQEYKQYVLLDFLSTVNKDIREEDIYYPIKRIFSMIKELTSVNIWMEKEFKDIPKDLPANIKKLVEYYENSKLEEFEKKEIKEIIENSLNILYKYADLGMDLWKNIESRIKSFNLERFGDALKKDNGILIFRNMSSDQLIAYWWQNGKTGRGSSGTLMKRVFLRNSYFSMSYEFIVHEIIEIMNLDHPIDPAVNIMEIYEDFNEESVTLKIAKELFIREISKEERERK